jgi:hypothetical protein
MKNMSIKKKRRSKKIEEIEKLAPYPESLAIYMLSFGSDPMAMSNISKEEFWGLMKLRIISKIYNIPRLEDVVNDYLKLRVSVGGQGRKDIIQVTTKESQQKQKSFISIIMSLLKDLLRFLMKIHH